MMTDAQHTEATPKRGKSPEKEAITGGQLPKFSWILFLAIGWGIAAGILLLTEAFSWAGTVAVGTLIFFVLVFIVSLAVEGKRRAVDRLVRYVLTSFFLLALLPLGSLIFEVVSRGAPRFDLAYFTETEAKAYDANANLGAAHALVGTLMTTAIAFIISVPIGLFTAIYLVEYGNKTKLAAGIRFLVDVMTGIPSIVAGLFAYALFSMLFGAGSPLTRTAFLGSIALSVLMIPTVVRSTEEMLKLVPNELREASYALGVPKWRTIVRIVLPTSLAGIVTGVILGIARIIGETAPLLVTAGYFQLTNSNPFNGPTATLPVMVYQSLKTIGPTAEQLHALGWTGALVLIIIVMGLNLIGRLIAWKFAPKQGH